MFDFKLLMWKSTGIMEISLPTTELERPKRIKYKSVLPVSGTNNPL